MVEEVYVLMGFGIAVILLRLIARTWAVGWKKLWWDDLLMLIAMIMLIITSWLAWSVTGLYLGLANNAMTDAQRTALDPNSTEYAIRVGGSKVQIAGQNCYTATLWTMKCSVCCFYWRLMSNFDGYPVRLRFAFGIVLVTWLTVHMTLWAGYYPFHKYWQINPNPGNFCQADISLLFIYTCVVLDVVSDAFLVYCPIPMLKKADLPRHRKVGLWFVFSGAIFVMVAAFLRCYFIVSDPVGGAAESGNWAIRETFVAICTSNFPVCWSSIRLVIRKIRDAAARRRANKQASDPEHIELTNKSNSNNDQGGGADNNNNGNIHDNIHSVYHQQPEPQQPQYAPTDFNHHLQQHLLQQRQQRLNRNDGSQETLVQTPRMFGDRVLPNQVSNDGYYGGDSGVLPARGAYLGTSVEVYDVPYGPRDYQTNSPRVPDDAPIDPRARQFQAQGAPCAQYF